MDTKQFLVLFVTLGLQPDVAANTTNASAGPTSSSNMTADDVISQLQRHIKRSLPSQYLPDDVVVLNSFPITSHGECIMFFLRNRRYEIYNQQCNMPQENHD